MESPWNRRILLGAGGVLAVAAAFAPRGERAVSTEAPTLSRHEKPYKPSERFLTSVQSFRTLYGTLGTGEIMFLNGDDSLLEIYSIGKHFETVKDGKPHDVPAGKFTSSGPLKGLLDGGFDPLWLEKARQDVCGRHNCRVDTAHDLPRQMNVIAPIRAAIEKTQGECRRGNYLDVVRYYGNKKVVTDPQFSRIEYVRLHANDHAAALPEEVRTLLPNLAVGLAATESHFDNDLKNEKSKAQGIFQFLPSAWKDLGRKAADAPFLSAQVLAFGEHLTKTYRYLDAKCASSLSSVQEEFFNDDARAFERYFLTPVLLNSFNAGEGLLRDVINDFVARYPTRRAFTEAFGEYPSGFEHDVFAVMAAEAKAHKVGNYGDDASAYVLRTYALANLLNKDAQSL